MQNGEAEIEKLKLAIQNCELVPNLYYNIATEKKPEYNSKFKNQVRELTITCKYDYNTVYRICSIFGFKEANNIINNYYDELIYNLFSLFWCVPYPMDEAEEEAARATLNSIDPSLPELFERLLDVSEYNSETLYRVFMAHGSDAEEIMTYAIDNELMPVQLLRYSDEKLSEGAAEVLENLKDTTFNKTRKSKEGKLPRKFRKGW